MTFQWPDGVTLPQTAGTLLFSFTPIRVANSDP